MIRTLQAPIEARRFNYQLDFLIKQKNQVSLSPKDRALEIFRVCTFNPIPLGFKNLKPAPIIYHSVFGFLKFPDSIGDSNRI